MKHSISRSCFDAAAARRSAGCLSCWPACYNWHRSCTDTCPCACAEQAVVNLLAVSVRCGTCCCCILQCCAGATVAHCCAVLRWQKAGHHRCHGTVCGAHQVPVAVKVQALDGHNLIIGLAAPLPHLHATVGKCSLARSFTVLLCRQK